MNDPTGYTIEIFCGEAIHEPAHPVLATLVQIEQHTFSIADGPVQVIASPHAWRVIGARAVDPTPRTTRDGLTGTSRIVIACECGLEALFGDRLGFSYSTYKAIHDRGESGGGEARRRSDNRRRSNFAKLDRLAVNGIVRLSLRALDRTMG